MVLVSKKFVYTLLMFKCARCMLIELSSSHLILCFLYKTLPTLSMFLKEQVWLFTLSGEKILYVTLLYSSFFPIFKVMTAVELSFVKKRSNIYFTWNLLLLYFHFRMKDADRGQAHAAPQVYYYPLVHFVVRSTLME